MNYVKNREMEKSSLRILNKSWAVAEIKISYKKKSNTGVKIKNNTDAYNVFLEMWDKDLIEIQEQFCAIFLNGANEVIGFRVITTGTLRDTIIDINLLLTCCLKSRASSVIVAHNHPSGNLSPSNSDIQITSKIKAACEVLNIDFLDHLIVTPQGCLSI